MSDKQYFIIDFDSTFIKDESLDVLFEVSLQGNPEKDEVVNEIKKITSLGMEGKLSFAEALQSRVKLLRANKSHIQKTIDLLQERVSNSFIRNKKFIEEYKKDIYIISGGFYDIIYPIVAEYGIAPSNVFANEFTFDGTGYITGFNTDNLLTQTKGKVLKIKSLDFKGDVFVIGDGFTDYEIKEAGLANKFFAFTENVKRETVTSKADHIVPSLDEFLFLNNLPRAQSYPKSRMNVLLLENIHPEAVKLFKEEGYNVETVKGALDEDELCERIKDVSILGIRSKTIVIIELLMKEFHY